MRQTPRFLMALITLSTLLPNGGCREVFPSFCHDRSVLVSAKGAPKGDFHVGAMEGATMASGIKRGVFGQREDVSLPISVLYPTYQEPGTNPQHCYDDIYPANAQVTPVAACNSPRPVVIYSHGNQSLRWASSFLLEHLATHGYVVAAMGHTDNTFFDGERGEEAFRDFTERRPLDVQDTLEWLVAQSRDQDSPLWGCVDEQEGYGVMGHSFGGYTALAVSGWDITPPGRAQKDHSDQRVWAVATMAPWDARGTLAEGNDHIDVPLLTLAGQKDEATTWPEVAALHEEVDTAPKTVGLLPKGGHITFAPMGCKVQGDGDGCGPDYVDLDVAAGLIAHSIQVFFDSARGHGGEKVTDIVSAHLTWNPPLP